jgi:hypothetical protein
MMVGGLVPAGRDLVDVHVEDRAAERRVELADPGLLPRLAQRRVEGRGVLALDVPAGLEPAAELPVKDQEERFPAGTRHDGARGHVTCRVLPRERILGRGDETPDPIEGRGLALVGGRVPRELLEKLLAVHSRNSRGSGLDFSVPVPKI